MPSPTPSAGSDGTSVFASSSEAPACTGCYWFFDKPGSPITDPCICTSGGPENQNCGAIFNDCLYKWYPVGRSPGGQEGNVTTLPVQFSLDQWAQAWSKGENLFGTNSPITFGLDQSTKGWNLRFNEGTCAGQVCPTDPCPPGSYLDAATEQCVQSVQGVPCKIPCWLSCAPALVQEAYCVVINYSLSRCSLSDALVCVGALAIDILAGDVLALTLTCLKRLLLSCVAGEVVSAINALIGWLELDPLACGCSPVSDPGCVAPEYAPPCNDGDCFTADGCCGPCDPPEPRAGGDPIEPGLTHSGSGGVTPVDGPSSGLPLHPLATPGFFVSNPHSREATIPVVPVLIAHPECFACNSADEQLELLEDEV